MSYEIRSIKGLEIKHEGKNVIGSDTLEVKIEQLDENTKSFVAIASTEKEDRDRDIVRQSGWVLTNFKRNPVIPWSHNYYSPPVARSLKTWIDNTTGNPRLMFRPKFDENDDDSMKIYNKYKNGFLSTFSVGFSPIEFKFRDENNRWSGGREFTKQELLEISCVSVPSNPGASTRLSFIGNGEFYNKSLISLGYPEIFSKTNLGLFYPITDIALFENPKEFEIEKGVVGVNAQSMDNSVKIDGPVAYIFDQEIFDDETANKWIKENASAKYTVKYFDIKFEENVSDGFKIDEIEEEKVTHTFEKSVDLINEKNDDLEIDNSELENDNNDELENKNDNNVNDELENDNNDELENKNDNVVEIKETIEVLTTLKDVNGNIIEQLINKFASSKGFGSIENFNNKSNELISLLLKDVKNIISTTIINELNDKKIVANNLIIDHNKGNIADDDSIELDDSFKNPGINDDSDSIIELDDSDLFAIKDVKNGVLNETFFNALKNAFDEALKNASGKID